MVSGLDDWDLANAERVYARSGDQPMAGVLLYTAAPDSEGTLGGLA